jgi:protein-L-isoaspartate(D-aspartate) O-methyltransferase
LTSRAPLLADQERLIRIWQEEEGFSPELLEAFRRVPRERFVRSHQQADAYRDFPLPIGLGQTISQPSTVMLMLHWLEVRSHHKVLEVGAGSGYNAALLGELARSVFSIERHPELVRFAQDNLTALAAANVAVLEGDGKQGLPEEAPFDRIILTAVARELPELLLDQLQEGGLLLAPIGEPHGCMMTRFLKTASGVQAQEYGRFAFVPLV